MQTYARLSRCIQVSSKSILYLQTGRPVDGRGRRGPLPIHLRINR